jgi:hypothetical protein
MSEPAVPAPPPAGSISAIERGVRGRRIIERAPRGWRCDEPVRRAADDRAPAAARGAPDGGAPPSPARFQFARNPLICLDRAKNAFPNISAPNGFAGRGGSGAPPRAGRRTAARPGPRAGFLLPATL